MSSVTTNSKEVAGVLRSNRERESDQRRKCHSKNAFGIESYLNRNRLDRHDREVLDPL